MSILFFIFKRCNFYVIKLTINISNILLYYYDHFILPKFNMLDIGVN